MKFIFYIKIVLISHILSVYSYAEDMIDHGIIQESNIYKTKDGFKLFLEKNYTYTVYKNGALKLNANRLFINGTPIKLSVYKFNKGIISNLNEAAIEKINHLKNKNNTFKSGNIKKINELKLQINYSTNKDNIKMKGIIVFIQKKRDLLALDVSTTSKAYINKKVELKKIAKSFSLI